MEAKALARRECENDCLERVVCDLCGSGDHEVVHPSRRQLQSISPEELAVVFCSSGDEYLQEPLVRCRRCGLQFVSPRLRQDLIQGGYRDAVDPTFVSQQASREITFAQSLAWLRRFLGNEPGKVLDVGTAGGAFLKVARSAGWDVCGCEPSRWLCQWAKDNHGLDIYPGTLGDILDRPGMEPGSFDLITLWDVLEHVPAPSQLLKQSAHLLKPGGLIVVNYPDINSIVARVMGRRWLFLTTVHLWYFTRKTIQQLLERNGYEVLKIRPYFQGLSLGYLLFRLEQFAGPFARAGGKIVEAMGLGQVMVKYNAGQTLVVARKRG